MCKNVGYIQPSDWLSIAVYISCKVERLISIGGNLLDYGRKILVR